MAFLDKFNNWYVRKIPETETGPVIVWREPAAGARYRWENKRHIQLLGLAALFLVLLLAPSRHGRGLDAMAFETRFWFAGGTTAVFAILQWFYRGSREQIALTSNLVAIGEGRNVQRIHFHEAQVTIEERNGHPVLIVTRPAKDPERVYLAPERVDEIRGFLTQAGRLGKS